MTTSPKRRRLLVVSHPNVVTLNQLVYARLLERGWDVHCIIPARWRDSYRPGGYRPEALPELAGRVSFLPVTFDGQPQRHFYRVRARRLVRHLRPDLAFVEQEPFSVPGLQWGLALRAERVPFALQADENLDRPFPLPARIIRRVLLPRTDGIAARSPRAGEMARAWGATGRIAVVPHTVPEWSPQPRRPGAPFTVGFAGRLVPEKGIDDLVAAIAGLGDPVRLLVIGDGPLRERLEAADLGGSTLDLRRGVTNADMPTAYGEMDLLVLPSRTTETWAEQYGRVLVEAMLCGRPVVGANSGEIPWVIRTSGGGRVYPEGDVPALRAVLEELRADPEQRARLADEGRRGAQEHFSVDAAATALEALLLDEVPARG